MGPGECIPIPADLSNFDECVRLSKELERREKGESKYCPSFAATALLTFSPSYPGMITEDLFSPLITR